MVATAAPTAVLVAATTAHAHAPASALLPWAVPVLVVLVGAGAYASGVAAYRSRRLRPWSRLRTVSWLTGTALVALGLSPVPGLLTDGARAHVLGHLLLGMLGPLGLVMAAPVTLLLGASTPRVGRAVGTVLGARPLRVARHPAVAAVLDVGGMFVLYLSPLYVLSQQHEVVGHLVHAHMLAAGYLFAWSVAGPDPAPRRPGLAARVTVLVVAGGAHGYLATTLYARAGALPPGAGHTVEDVRAAAQLMSYGGDLAALLLAVALFASWYRRTAPGGRRARAGPPVPASTERRMKA